MSKNITISEGSQAKNFNNVSKIRTNVIGGGTQNWVPEDEAGMYANLGVAEIDKNGIYKASDENLDGFSQVAVSVQPKTKTKTITKNGTYKASKDKVDGYSEVSVEVPTGGSGELITKDITSNGTYNASDDNADGYSSVTVNVSGGGSLITKEITKNGTYNASDDNADGYSSVTVNVSFPYNKVLVGDISNIPVSNRISTDDFLQALNQAVFNVVQPRINPAYLSSVQHQLLDEAWLSSIPDIHNRNNLLMFGGGGKTAGDSGAAMIIWLWFIGVADETATVSITNPSVSRFNIELSSGKKFYQSNGLWRLIMHHTKFVLGSTADYTSMVANIDNHILVNDSDASYIYQVSHGNLFPTINEYNTGLMTNLRW